MVGGLGQPERLMLESIEDRSPLSDSAGGNRRPKLLGLLVTFLATQHSPPDGIALIKIISEPSPPI